jgi:hypothetical protein
LMLNKLTDWDNYLIALNRVRTGLNKKNYPCG